MTEEDKKLLLKELCARLPYKVECEAILNNGGSYPCVLDIGTLNWHISGDHILKPYLRPMSSMTEEEKKYIEDKCAFTTMGPIGGRFCSVMPVVAAEWLIEFYNSHYLDWKGLIPKGLALEAPEGMYSI